MSIMIFSGLGDSHAITVEAALHYADKKCLRLSGDEFPGQMEITLHLSNDIENDNTQINHHALDDIATVWLRRRIGPKYISEDIREEDRAIALQEADEFWKAFLYGDYSTARWINPVAAKLTANSKIYQLKVARVCGFTIPPSLFSNKPEAIRNFVSQVGTCIFKSFAPVSWVENEQIVAMYANQVQLSDLQDDLALRYAPGIFQKAIPKQFEVRATCMGKKIIGAKLNAKRHNAEPQDWRLGYYGNLNIEPFQFEPAMESRILRFMQAMNLEYGAIDLIYSTDGEWYFLEVNESGQFLWVEGFNPEIRMLQNFCEFLLPEQSLPALSYRDIRDNCKVPQIIKAEMESRSGAVRLDQGQASFEGSESVA